MQTYKKRKFALPFILFSFLFSLSLICAIFISGVFTNEKEASSDYVDTSFPTVIIDAGHGGEDGGAVGINGVFEKDLNLEISNDLCDLLRSTGINVIMTRNDDSLLYDRNVDFHGKKKVLDLAARLEIANNVENAIFVSIHMNSFPEQKYSGLQVYYSKNTDNSKSLAEKIQTSVKEHIQPNNTRVCKSSENIYLLDKAKNTSVLVECGFLSNHDECSLLSTDEYRKELAIAIFNGIYEYIIEVDS